MRPDSLGRLALLACFCLLTACTQWRYDLGTPLAQTAFPDSKEQQRLVDVLATLGPPQRLSATDTGFVLAWEHWQVDEDTLGIRLGFMGADILSMDWGKAHVRGEFLLLTFNRDYLLTGSAYSEWDSNLGGGKGVQPFLGFVSLVDVADLTRRMPQHSWGAATLKSIPSALNRESNSNTGQNVVEQRGTPNGVGQQSLEMH